MKSNNTRTKIIILFVFFLLFGCYANQIIVEDYRNAEMKLRGRILKGYAKDILDKHVFEARFNIIKAFTQNRSQIEYMILLEYKSKKYLRLDDRKIFLIIDDKSILLDDIVDYKQKEGLLNKSDQNVGIRIKGYRHHPIGAYRKIGYVSNISDEPVSMARESALYIYKEELQVKVAKNIIETISNANTVTISIVDIAGKQIIKYQLSPGTVEAIGDFYSSEM
ncbi:hypothetical protein ACFLZV_00930 [Candidatus Margulisiibacteriota bacterium]